MKTNKSIKVVTGLVRFENVHLYEPSSVVGSKKYSLTLVIDKAEVETINKINAAYLSLKNENQVAYSKKSMMPKALRNGDIEKIDQIYKGAYFLTASSIEKPGIVDKDLNPLIGVGDVYDGCYGRASITLFIYEFNGKFGIGAGLNNIQKLKEGKRAKTKKAGKDFC